MFHRFFLKKATKFMIFFLKKVLIINNNLSHEAAKPTREEKSLKLF